MKKIYYIAGPISDRLDTYKEDFNFMANDLKEQGHIVLNPSVLPGGLNQEQYMDICLAMLRCATNIIMLEDWEKSEGARIEHDLAIKSESITVEYAA